MAANRPSDASLGERFLSGESGIKIWNEGAEDLGVVILNAKNSFRPDLVLAAVVISSALTLVLFAITAMLQHVVLRWRDVGDGR